MNKLLTTTAVALLLSIAPALAADDSDMSDQSAQPQASQSDESALPSDTDITPKASEPSQPQAANSDDGGQSATSSSVSPGAANEAKVPDNGSPDTSTGAKESSSAPPQSGAVMDKSNSNSSTE
jgi:hypothetical protein